MGWFLGAGVLPACLFAAWLIVRRPIRQFVEEMDADRARDLFHHDRERLEARFLGSLARRDPEERARWEDSHWHDQVVWARDRRTRRFLALIGIHFDASDPFDELPDPDPRHATALFEFHKGRWHAEGRALDAIEPDEAVRRNQRFEPVIPQPRRP